MELYDDISKILIRLMKHDLSVRERLMNDGSLFIGYNSEMEGVHRENATRLKEIIQLIGWPTISKVGAEASDAAWLIVQHSIGEPNFIKDSYKLLLASKGDINPQNIAYIYDRICYFEGRPQRYATQYDDRGLYPVEDKDMVNPLRAAHNLPPIELDIMNEIKPNEINKELHTDSEMNEWRIRMGWITEGAKT